MMPLKQDKDARSPTNYRKTRRTQEKNLLYLVIFVLVVVGTGLIGLIWGVNSALLGGACLIGGAVLIVGLWLLLSWIQKLIEE
jgi:hypothetical protein